jgi:hypothetical protein
MESIWTVDTPFDGKAGDRKSTEKFSLHSVRPLCVSGTSIGLICEIYTGILWSRPSFSFFSSFVSSAIQVIERLMS